MSSSRVALVACTLVALAVAAFLALDPSSTARAPEDLPLEDVGGVLTYAPEWGYGFSDVVEVFEGAAFDIAITVEALPGDRVLAGTVYSATGEPRRGALVDYHWTSPAGRHERTYTHSSKDGRFTLLQKAGARDGALQVSVYQDTERSNALHHIDAGTVGHELRLLPPRFVELRAEDSDGEPYHAVSVFLYRQLAGHWVHDYPGPTQRRGEPLLWGLPTVPFKVQFKNKTYGPFEPDQVGNLILMRDDWEPKFVGRVLRHGKAHAQAKVSLIEFDAEGRPKTREHYSRPTDAFGRFTRRVKPGRYEIRAWDESLGEGRAGPFDIAATDITDIEVHIDRDPAALFGTVLLPPGRHPREVWLSTSRLGGYLRLFPDGSYRIPTLLPGEHRVRVLGGITFVSDDADFDQEQVLTEDYGPPGTRFYTSHGPSGPPGWLATDVMHVVDLAPGEQRRLDIDLVQRSHCWLDARLDAADLFDDFAAMTPKLFVLGADESIFAPSVSSARILPDGRFALGAREPGTYVLQISQWMGDCQVRIRDEIVLVPGEQAWRLELSRGSLRVLPRIDASGRPRPENIRLRQTVGTATVTVSGAPYDATTGVREYSHVPAGQVEILRKLEGAWVPAGQVWIEEGTTAEFTLVQE